MTNSKSLQYIVDNYLIGQDDSRFVELSKLMNTDSALLNNVLSLITSEFDEEVKSGAIRAVGELNPELLANPFNSLMESTNYQNRATASYLCGVYKITSLKGQLERLLIEDESPDVRYWSAASLGEIGDATSLTILEQAKNDGGEADNQDTVEFAAKESISRIAKRIRFR